MFRPVKPAPGSGARGAVQAPAERPRALCPILFHTIKNINHGRHEIPEQTGFISETVSHSSSEKSLMSLSSILLATFSCLAKEEAKSVDPFAASSWKMFPIPSWEKNRPMS